MAYEKLLNEIYAALSLEYLWPAYRPCFVKSESPDWINEGMDLGLEVSQALLPEDGRAESFLEEYLGRPKTDLPASAFARYGERLHFYNGRFWAILPKTETPEDVFDKAVYRFERKLEKLNRNYRRCRSNGLYLFLHPLGNGKPDMERLFSYMRQRQSKEPVRFDWVFLNCIHEIYVCDFQRNSLETIPLPENAESFLNAEAERLRHSDRWASGTLLDGYAIKVMRATKTWQQAGAYYVRIQGMGRQHHIPLEREFDAHDTPETKYIVLLDHDFPVGTCRLFGIDGTTAEIGRVVVLEKYRGRGLGRLLLHEAEKWIRELGFSVACVESRDVAVKFYEKLGYIVRGQPYAGDTFVCVHMEKELL